LVIKKWLRFESFRPKFATLAVFIIGHPCDLLTQQPLANNADQQKPSQYARNFQQTGAAALLNPALLTAWVKDQALLPGALNDAWKWLEKDLTLVTIPSAGHFVQQDVSELQLVCWLTQR
jgi:pimeloyl-ACP methyl ester carboxylesterase